MNIFQVGVNTSKESSCVRSQLQSFLKEEGQCSSWIRLRSRGFTWLVVSEALIKGTVTADVSNLVVSRPFGAHSHPGVRFVESNPLYLYRTDSIT